MATCGLRRGCGHVRCMYRTKSVSDCDHECRRSEAFDTRLFLCRVQSGRRSESCLISFFFSEFTMSWREPPFVLDFPGHLVSLARAVKLFCEHIRQAEIAAWLMLWKFSARVCSFLLTGRSSGAALGRLKGTGVFADHRTPSLTTTYVSSTPAWSCLRLLYMDRDPDVAVAVESNHWQNGVGDEERRRCRRRGGKVCLSCQTKQAFEKWSLTLC